MPTRILREPRHADALADLLRGLKLPVTVSWTTGASRSQEQNRLSHAWYRDISDHFGDRTASEVRAECKTRFGVPIMCAHDDAFRQTWSRGIGVLPYDMQVDTVRVLEVPVTRLMGVRLMTEYLDTVHREFTPQGVRLTDPEAFRYLAEFGPLEGAA